MWRRDRIFSRIGPLGLAAMTSACAATATAPAVSDAGGGAQSLRVLTYNIHHGAGNDDCVTPLAPAGTPPNAACSLDLERIAAVIREANVDVAGLQEVDRYWARSGGVDQAAALGAMLNMQTCFGANLTHGADTHASVPHEYGTLVMSRHAIASCANTLLPRAGQAAEQRGLLKAGIRTGSVLLDFYNTHLHTLEADRRVQVDEIVRRIGATTLPAMLAGDLNARPSDAYLLPLFAALPDTWAIAGSDPGFTSPASPLAQPRHRIDYVLASRGITVAAAAVLTTSQTAFASDHYPVVVDVAVEPPRAASTVLGKLHD